MAPATTAHVSMMRASQRRPPILCKNKLLGTSHNE
jgi:hypothetical protein